MKKLLSIVICTRNRPDSLRRTLQSLVKSARDCARDRFEILVVDNGGFLDRAVWEAEFSPPLPLRLIREERPGLSIARNTGVASAGGEWILWTDDDVSVDSRWISTYLAAVERFPEASVMGGPIVPVFDDSPPEWLIEGQPHIRTAFAARAPDDVKAVFLAGDAIPWGANFATRRAGVLQFPFDSKLGRHPTRPTGGGEESAVIQQILSAGGTGRWLKEASVLHHIDCSRQTQKYVRDYYFELGLRNAVSTEPVRGRWKALDYCFTALYRALGNEIRYTAARLQRGRPLLALHLKNAAKNWGAARAWLNEARGNGSLG